MTTENLFDAIARELGESHPIERDRQFGKPCLKSGGKVFALLDGEAMVFRLDEEGRRRALILPGAALWEPHASRGPMQDWVSVPAGESAQWGTLAAAALKALEG